MIQIVFGAGAAISLLATAWLDAVGFLHASRVWRSDRFMFSEALLSSVYFASGILGYILALSLLTQLGVRNVELQVSISFLATVIGVAILNGSIANWALVDILCGVAAVLLLTFLAYRVA